jgi:hypothetical protein
VLSAFELSSLKIVSPEIVFHQIRTVFWPLPSVREKRPKPFPAPRFAIVETTPVEGSTGVNRRKRAAPYSEMKTAVGETDAIFG